MKRLTYYLCGILLLLVGIMPLSAQSQYKDTLVVARDGSGDYRTLTEAMEGIRAFMDYKVTVLIKNGAYKEKAIIPSWVQNVDFIGESVENTIITYDDHANINKMGTFRTYTVKVQGNNITFKNLTIENNAATPEDIAVGYVFKNCKLTANPGVDKVYLGRPWRPYAATVFINCEMGKHIRPEGWHNWGKEENEKTARYAEYNSTGEGAAAAGRVKWAKQLTKKEAAQYDDLNYVYRMCSDWKPEN